MPWFKNIENTNPPDIGESPRLGASRIRDWKEAVCERLKGIFYGFEPDDSESDDTKKGIIGLPFHKQASAPSESLDKIKLYAKEVNGITELFAKDSAGNDKQLTSGGKLNIEATEAVLLAGNQNIEGNKTFKGETTFENIPTLPDSNPTADNDAARKKYVDDKQIPFATGVVAKYGHIAANITGSGTITHGFNTTNYTLYAIVSPGGHGDPGGWLSGEWGGRMHVTSIDSTKVNYYYTRSGDQFAPYLSYLIIGILK
jgi:hypothetical protein